MTPQTLIGILCGLAAVVIVIYLLRDLLIDAYKFGYEQGRKDAADWWARAAEDVEQMREEIREGEL